MKNEKRTATRDGMLPQGVVAMQKFSAGQTVKIHCEVQKGAFPTERLVTFETAHGPISGFVRSENVELANGHDGFVDAVVKEVSSDILTVVVKGSFFTTTGLAYLKRDWADANVRVRNAAA